MHSGFLQRLPHFIEFTGQNKAKLQCCDFAGVRSLQVDMLLEERHACMKLVVLQGLQ